MDFRTLSGFVLRRWWALLVPIVAVTLLTVPSLLQNEQSNAGGFQTSFLYSAAQQTSNLPARDGDYQDVWLASEFVVNAFTDWIKSSSFRAELAQVLNDPTLDLSALGIATDNKRSIGSVALSYPDASALEHIANATIEVLQTRNQAYFPHLGESPAVVTLLDVPVVSPAPAPLTNRLVPLIRIALAGAFGFFLALGLEYFDRTLRQREELEAQGFKVLGTIPRSKP